MACCNDPYNLGCFDSCQKVTITNLGAAYAANELFIRYDFNGAVRRKLITEVSADGEPIIDLSDEFNEDYIYTFELVIVATNEPIGCYKMRVDPCAGDFFDSPVVPAISNYLNSTIVFGSSACSGETEINFVVDIVDVQLAALADDTLINFIFQSSVPVTALEVVSNDANIVVQNPTQVKILDASAVTSIALILKVSNCAANDITAVVSSFVGLTPTWGNGIHTPDTKTI